MPGSTKAYRIGYCTSGLAHHRLPEALDLLADLGYRGVFLTLDPGHLDPLSPRLDEDLREIRDLLRKRDLAAVVETGGRYVLDPRRKHWPVLLSEGAERRERFLMDAIRIAAELESPAVSFWSGGNPLGLAGDEALDRLSEAISRLLEEAKRRGVVLAMEPEPGMFIERVADFHRLRTRMGAPEGLRLSLDCGHPLATGEGEPHDIVRAEKDLLECIAIEDMNRGVHEHLPFGEGDLDLQELLSAIDQSGFAGVVAVELGRHSHRGAEEAVRAREHLMALGVPFGGAR